MPVDRALRVESNEDLGASHFLMTLGAPDDVPAWQPGQFAMITVGPRPHQHDPLLRRPFSIFNACGSPRGGLQILYRSWAEAPRCSPRRAPATFWSASRRWAMASRPGQPGDKLLLVAGGIGSASLHPLALAERTTGQAPVVLYGCRTAASQAGIEPTRRCGIQTQVITDDGSAGRRGLVTNLLDSFLAGQGSAAGSSIVCACGPTAMMRATAGVCAQRGVRCHVSLESTMACGFGVCVGCVVGSREQPPTARCATGRSASRGQSSSTTEIAW